MTCAIVTIVRTNRSGERPASEPTGIASVAPRGSPLAAQRLRPTTQAGAGDCAVGRGGGEGLLRGTGPWAQPQRLPARGRDVGRFQASRCGDRPSGPNPGGLRTPVTCGGGHCPRSPATDPAILRSVPAQHLGPLRSWPADELHFGSDLRLRVPVRKLPRCPRGTVDCDRCGVGSLDEAWPVRLRAANSGLARRPVKAGLPTPNARSKTLHFRREQTLRENHGADATDRVLRRSLRNV